MKLLMTAVLAFSMVGVAEGQDLRGEKAIPPDASSLKALIGVAHIPEVLHREAGSERQALNASSTYAGALSLYTDRLKVYADAPAPESPGPEGVDCAMVHWADTTAASMPTLTPRPGVDARMPVLQADAGCTRPQKRPDLLSGRR